MSKTFKAPMIKMHQQTITNALETHEKIASAQKRRKENTGREIEDMKKNQMEI